MSPHGDSEFSLCPTLVTRRKNIFLYTINNNNNLIILSCEGPFENYHGINSVLKLDVCRSPPEIFRTMRSLPPSFSKAQSK